MKIYYQLTDSIDFFCNGKLMNVEPRGSNSYCSRYIFDGRTYDMLSPDDVKELPIPNFSQDGSFPDVTHSEDYILRMIAGYIREINHEQSIIVLNKANILMQASNISWCTDDYLRLAEWLYQDGKIELAEKYENAICEKIPSYYSENGRKRINKEILDKALEECKKLHTPFIEFASVSGGSEIDGVYGNRIYSTSKANLKVRSLPKLDGDYYGTFYPFINGISQMYDRQGKEVIHPLLYSNRLFIDERTESDKKLYKEKQLEIQKHNELWMDAKRFYYLKNRHPDICPKSKYAFEKLKREHFDEWQKLIIMLPKSYQLFSG